jgi:hypothetical protein
MDSDVTLFATVVLLALVAISCTTLCLVWTVPSLRHYLAPGGVTSKHGTGGLQGRAARLGIGLVSVATAACAGAAWYGCYLLLATG